MFKVLKPRIQRVNPKELFSKLLDESTMRSFESYNSDIEIMDYDTFHSELNDRMSIMVRNDISATNRYTLTMDVTIYGKDSSELKSDVVHYDATKDNIMVIIDNLLSDERIAKANSNPHSLVKAFVHISNDQSSPIATIFIHN